MGTTSGRNGIYPGAIAGETAVGLTVGNGISGAPNDALASQLYPPPPPDDLPDEETDGEADNSTNGAIDIALTNRERFVRRLGWSHDPFETSVAEREYNRLDLSGWADDMADSRHRRTETGRRRDRLVERATALPGQVYSRILAPVRNRPASGPAVADRPATLAVDSAGGLSHVSPSFLPSAYYVDPVQSRDRKEATFRTLRKPFPTIVFGAPGAGKTTLRLGVETDLRTWPDGTLIVTYRPAKLFELRQWTKGISIDDHKQAMAVDLAIDLFIQIVERFDTAAPRPSARQNSYLCRLVKQCGDRSLMDVMKRMMQSPPPPNPWGIGCLWHLVDRSPVRSVESSTAMRRWLDELKTQNRIDGPEHPKTPKKLWELALETAHVWNFKRIYVQVDGIDEFAETPGEMLPLIHSLLADTMNLAEEDVFLKLYLPDVLEEPLRDGDLKIWGYVNILRLDWSPHRLRALLIARFRAVGSYRIGFGDLAEPELGDQIDEMLIESAGGSPRRLIELVSALITAYTRRQTDLDFTNPITREDWTQALCQVTSAARI